MIQAWGRRARASWGRGLLSACFMFTCPLISFMPWISLQHHGASLIATLGHINKDGLKTLPCPSFGPTFRNSVFVYAGWNGLQSLLFAVVPGRICLGPMTPAGNVLQYKINGLETLVVSIALLIGLSLNNIIDPGWIGYKWEDLLLIGNAHGFILAFLAYFKAHVWPTRGDDSKFSGSWFYDFYMGIELNPRLGRLWDVKLFHVGRGGMLTWLLVDLSFTAYQYQLHGYITNSILVVDFLHALYVVDFFVNEEWYLRTIDIEHDHFGFYFAWGSAAFLPAIYTIQAQYLAQYPVPLTLWQERTILFIGIGGYLLFRSANNQKLIARQSPDTCRIWNDEPVFIKCQYKTIDGTIHESNLLCSGWWGVVRHANYLGDLLLSYATCAACGTNHVLPWTYAIFLTTILTHRCIRDEERCSLKYGKDWDTYCERVRWRILPGIF